MTSVRKATVLALAQRYCVFVVQLLTSVVLARLLTPSETGVFSLAMALVGIAQMLRDFGIGEYVVKERELSREQLRSVLGASILLSWAIALCLVGAASPVAAYYKTPGVSNVLMVLALNFVLLPVGSTAVAVLNKELAFKELFIVNVSASLVGAGTCVFLAWSGHGFMSLAWSSLVATCTTVLVLALLRPSLTFMLPSFKGLVVIGRFGGALTIGRMFDQAARRVPDFVIASSLGFHSLGLNSKAGTLLESFHEFFASAVSRVATPAFARQRHADTDSKAPYLFAIELLSIFPFVFFGLMILLADPLIRLLFGPAWVEVVPLLQIVSLGGIISGPYMLAPPLLTAHGRVGALLRIQIPGAVVMIAAVVVAAPHGLVMIAFAGLGAHGVKIALIHRELARCARLNAAELAAAISKSALIGLLSVAAAAAVLPLDDGTLRGAVTCLGIAGPLTAIIALVGVMVLRHPLADELRSAWRYRWKAG